VGRERGAKQEFKESNAKARADQSRGGKVVGYCYRKRKGRWGQPLVGEGARKSFIGRAVRLAVSWEGGGMIELESTVIRGEEGDRVKKVEGRCCRLEAVLK